MMEHIRDFLLYSQNVMDLQYLIKDISGYLFSISLMSFAITTVVAQILSGQVPNKIFLQTSKSSKIFWMSITSIVVSISLSGTSLIADPDILIFTPLFILLITSVVLILVYSCFSEMFKLINPEEQIKQETRSFDDEIKRILSIIERRHNKASLMITDKNIKNIYTFERYLQTEFKSINLNWSPAFQASLYNYLFYFKKYYSKGDYDVAETSIKEMVNANAIYLKHIGNSYQMEEVDDIVRQSLIGLKSAWNEPLRSGDELAIEMVFNTLKDLAVLSCNGDSKSFMSPNYSLVLIYINELHKECAANSMDSLSMKYLRIISEIVLEAPNMSPQHSRTAIYSMVQVIIQRILSQAPLKGGVDPVLYTALECVGTLLVSKMRTYPPQVYYLEETVSTADEIMNIIISKNIEIVNLFTYLQPLVDLDIKSEIDKATEEGSLNYFFANYNKILPEQNRVTAKLISIKIKNNDYPCIMNFLYRCIEKYSLIICHGSTLPEAYEVAEQILYPFKNAIFDLESSKIALYLDLSLLSDIKILEQQGVKSSAFNILIKFASLRLYNDNTAGCDFLLGFCKTNNISKDDMRKHMTEEISRLNFKGADIALSLMTDSLDG